MKTSKVDVCVSALLTVSEEVRSRCSLKHRKSLLLSEVTMENFPMDTFTVFETEPGCRWELFFSCFLSTIYLSFQPHCIVFFNDFFVLLILTLSKVSGYCVKTSPGLLQKCQSATLHLHTLPWGRPAFAHANPWAWTWASLRKPMQRNYWVWVVCGFIL